MLPESLDVLVEAGYLADIPVHPFTGEQMGYFRDAPFPSDVLREDEVGGAILGMNRASWSKEQVLHYDTGKRAVMRNGGTYLRLGKWVYVIVENNELRRLESGMMME